MATLERPRSPAARAASVAGAPTAFPVDELVALRGDRPASEEGSPTPAAASASLGSREQQPSPVPRDPFADEQRSDHPATHHDDPHHYPPSYTDDDAPVPDYQERPSSDLADKPDQPHPAAHDDASFPPSGVSLLSEKRQQDFSNLSDAIDRLNVVAPQLHNQRVELAAGKQSELELARMVGRGRMDDQYALLAGKGKARAGVADADGQDDAELQKIWQSIEKAHGRRIDGQDSMLDLAQHDANEARRRGEFIAGLADRNDAGRLEDQDWDVVQRPAAEGGDLITVDQFIHENGRASSSSAGPSRTSGSPKPSSMPELKRLSGSALLGRRGSIKDGFARLVNGSAATEEARRSRRRSASPPPPTPPASSAGASFVAELQENIRVVQVSLFVPAGGDYVLRVAPDDARTAVLTPVGGPSTAAPLRLALPADALPQQDLPVRPSAPATYSFRLPALARPPTASADADAGAVAFSAESLASAAPSSLLCARCSAPLVDSSAVQPANYGALPSEHWEELIGSWLCHDEMKLDLGDEGGGGVFWPKRSEILVGGTYVMLKEALLVPQSWRPRAGGETELWQPIVCARCTAPLGRRFLQPHPTDPSSTVKLLKYAFRLPNRPPPPLPAFVAQDLLELADSHRSYHFVLEAEEREGHPRLLIWLFNTSIFVTAQQAGGAAHGDVPTRAVKVLFLDLGEPRPAADSHPAPAIPPTFPVQSAETVSYPAAVVDELAAVLAVHNGAFPPAGRQMMGLSVSWMERF